uniref:phospholipid scramblase 1-like isoform X2 n=1 Tax=Jaculus jaculus TaxID=51337 RepID=UPI001E1B5D53|nr:phospholipid scramblase 1-like isoform X2 [Jaculus jaculus]
MQKDTLQAELGYPAVYPPQYPPAAFQGAPGNTGYTAPQTAYTGPQAGYQRPQLTYPGPQSAYPEPQAGYPVPPGGYAGAGSGSFPVQIQPGGPTGTPWIPAPPPPVHCPPGLEYLTQIDQILVHQQIELLEVLTGFETNNKYEIKNSLGQRIYFAVEDTDCCTRNCCGPLRPFTLRILDNLGQEVMTLERPLRCGSCCFPCCLQEIEIQAPPGVPVGYVTQTWHPCLPKFTLQNEKREDVLKVGGPCVVCSCCSDVDFQIKSLDEESIVGKISKHWSGLVREAFTDADNFGIQFPLNLDVKMKAVMLGACFLIGKTSSEEN